MHMAYECRSLGKERERERGRYFFTPVMESSSLFHVFRFREKTKGGS